MSYIADNKRLCREFYAADPITVSHMRNLIIPNLRKERGELIHAAAQMRGTEFAKALTGDAAEIRTAIITGLRRMRAAYFDKHATHNDNQSFASSAKGR